MASRKSRRKRKKVVARSMAVSVDGAGQRRSCSEERPPREQRSEIPEKAILRLLLSSREDEPVTFGYLLVRRGRGRRGVVLGGLDVLPPQDVSDVCWLCQWREGESAAGPDDELLLLVLWEPGWTPRGFRRELSVLGEREARDCLDETHLCDQHRPERATWDAAVDVDEEDDA